MSEQVTELTRRFWLETVLLWAEQRLPPPQYDECKRALSCASAELAAMARALDAERTVEYLQTAIRGALETLGDPNGHCTIANCPGCQYERQSAIELLQGVMSAPGGELPAAAGEATKDETGA